MIHSSFLLGAREIKGELSSFFTASHPNIRPSSAIPLTHITHGNTGRDKKEAFGFSFSSLFSSSSLLSLLGYKIIGRNGCTLMSSLLPPIRNSCFYMASLSASSNLSLSPPDVLHNCNSYTKNDEMLCNTLLRLSYLNLPNM